MIRTTPNLPCTGTLNLKYLKMQDRKTTDHREQDWILTVNVITQTVPEKCSARCLSSARPSYTECSRVFHFHNLSHIRLECTRLCAGAHWGVASVRQRSKWHSNPVERKEPALVFSIWEHTLADNNNNNICIAPLSRNIFKYVNTKITQGHIGIHMSLLVTSWNQHLRR